MPVGMTVIVVAAIIAVIWIFIELKRFKHKIVAILLVALILFSYLGFLASIKGKDIDFKSVDGVKTAGQLYFSWLGKVFKNVKTITTNAIKMDWKGSGDSGSGG